MSLAYSVYIHSLNVQLACCNDPILATSLVLLRSTLATAWIAHSCMQLLS